MASEDELPADMDPVASEHLVWTRRANRTQNESRSVGGWLYLTNRRVAFRPHAVDAALSGQQSWYPLETVVAVSKEKKSLRAIQGGSLRDRLKLTIDDGTVELFVVNKLDDVISELRQATGMS